MSGATRSEGSRLASLLQIGLFLGERTGVAEALDGIGVSGIGMSVDVV